MADWEDAEHNLLCKNPGKTKSVVWDYFGFRKRIDGPAVKSNLDVTTAVCRLCKKSYANKSNTTNLMSHLEHDHSSFMQTAKELKHASQEKQPKIFKAFQPPSTQIGHMTRKKSTQIDDSLHRMMVRKVLPYSLVECDYFKEFVAELDSRYVVPGKKKVQASLENKMKEMERKLAEDLKMCPNIAITHDSWTSCNTESYSTVTGHYIDSNWELKAVSLQTTKIVGSHTGENIAKHLAEVKTTWNLSSIVAVTDNAANEKKAFEILGWTRFGCYGHRINLIVRHSLSEQSVARLIGKGRKLVTFFHQSSSASDLLRAKQLLLAADQDPLKLIMDVPTRWNSTLLMLRRILKLTPCIIAVASDNTLNKTAATTIKNCSFTFDEQSLIERLVNILEPFLNATESVSSDKRPTLHKVMPILHKIEKCTADIEGDPEPIKHVKARMRKEVDKRTMDTELALLACVLNPFAKNLAFLKPSEVQEAKDLLLSKALDENNNFVKIKQEKSEEVTQLNEDPVLPVLPELHEISSDTNNNVQEQSATPHNDPEVTSDINEITIGPSPKKMKMEMPDMDDWLSDIEFIGETKQPISSVIHQEVERYFAANCADRSLTMLKWWKANEQYYPRISALARKYLAIPASSVPSERIFSLCGAIVSKKRSRLNPENVNMMVFLNKNMELFW